VLTIAAVIAVVAIELVWFRTGILATATYWVALAIVLLSRFRWMAG